MKTRNINRTLAAGILVTAVALFACKKVMKEVTKEALEETEVTPAASPIAAPGAASPVGTPAINHFTETAALTTTLNALKTKIGGGSVKALEFSIYDTYANLQAQDPSKAAEVNEFKFRAGTVTGPIPVKLSGGGKLDRNLFTLDDVALDKLPAMTAEALEKSKIEDGKITHVIVRRGLPFSPKVVVRVYVDSPRKDGFVEFSETGVIGKINVD